MSWARGAQDDLGREIGYAIKAECDFEGCEIEIDRGLSYCCGTMHNNENEDGCGRYFCPEHLHSHPCEPRDVAFLKSVGEYEEEDDA